jgi:hypothetical protein
LPRTWAERRNGPGAVARDRATDNVAGDLPVVEPFIQSKEADRVEVEDRAGHPEVSLGRVVAGQDEEVVDACAREPPAQAEELVAIAVSAGDVDDHLLTGLGKLRGEDLGTQHRVAAGAVGD